MNKEDVKLSGIITDKNKVPLENADVFLMNSNFEDICKTKTDQYGKYTIIVEKGLDYLLAIVKDYSVKFLEYWVWNLPLLEDVEINACIDGLEVYAINVFRIQGAFPALTVYFRPMSLHRAKNKQENDKLKQRNLNDISPKLVKSDIDVFIDNEKVEVYEINKVNEYTGLEEGYHQSMCGYLMQIQMPKNFDKTKYFKIDIKIRDTETDEYGEGTVFWKLCN
ncbi:carboxypeptidase regulatory-like domain-containing protein [Sedimentibacter sp. zth1]|uniref:carboxypeptidase-like regulatory domain-containing protein n=1 Tax=Sedimentibacter sp. zth1 TaxID=2816908 RepID=UPI001A936C83|nr:carboxypeptidase-like regulatory domain-containing protein [Sedimentibacter sp. zth1]QSX04678.1 carboxypeptidase regulatory-like domain-containing protein [Sedimentibacter sp. zth1]